jgi:hypothetical protein
MNVDIRKPNTMVNAKLCQENLIASSSSQKYLNVMNHMTITQDEEANRERHLFANNKRHIPAGIPNQ